jgi:hypothetical protein
MGLFERTIKNGMENPEFKQGWDEAEAELAAYYASISPAENHASVAKVSIRIFLSQPELVPGFFVYGRHPGLTIAIPGTAMTVTPEVRTGAAR